MLLATVAQESNGFDRHGWQLAWTLTSFLDRRGYWRDYLAAQTAGLEAAVRIADTRGQAHMHRNLGTVHVKLRQPRLGRPAQPAGPAPVRGGRRPDRAGPRASQPRLGGRAAGQLRRGARTRAVRPARSTRRPGTGSAWRTRSTSSAGVTPSSASTNRRWSTAAASIALFEELGDRIGRRRHLGQPRLCLLSDRRAAAGHRLLRSRPCTSIAISATGSTRRTRSPASATPCTRPATLTLLSRRGDRRWRFSTTWVTRSRTMSEPGYNRRQCADTAVRAETAVRADTAISVPFQQPMKRLRS